MIQMGRQTTVSRYSRLLSRLQGVQMAELLHVRDASEEEGLSHIPAKRPFPRGYASLITFPKDAGVLAHNPLA